MFRKLYRRFFGSPSERAPWMATNIRNTFLVHLCKLKLAPMWIEYKPGARMCIGMDLRPNRHRGVYAYGLGP